MSQLYGYFDLLSVGSPLFHTVSRQCFKLANLYLSVVFD